MLVDIAHQRSQSLLRQRKVLLLAAAASFGTNIALFSALSSKDREIVLQPIATRPLTISSSGVEADYLELVTRDVALMLLKRLHEEDRRMLAAYFGVKEAVLGGPQEWEQPTLQQVPVLDVYASAGHGAADFGDRPAHRYRASRHRHCR